MIRSVRIKVQQDADGGVVYVNGTPAYMFSGDGDGPSVDPLEPDAGKRFDDYRDSVLNAVRYHNSMRETEMCMGREPPAETEMTFSVGRDGDPDPDFRPFC